MTGHLALPELICDRQTVIKRFALGLGPMVSATSNLVKQMGPKAPWVWARRAQTQGASALASGLLDLGPGPNPTYPDNWLFHINVNLHIFHILRWGGKGF